MKQIKTPEQLADEYAEFETQGVPDSIRKQLLMTKDKMAFLAGYQAAKNQLADNGKVTTADYVETAINDAKQLIRTYKLEGDKDILIKALVAAYCSGVDAVDGYLRNSLSAYRNSVKRLQWISVKERLPEEDVDVAIGWFQKTASNKTFWTVDAAQLTNKVFSGWRVYSEVTHWMPLPKPPEEK
jgi:hypothetical protein